ncbi:hypothetical protein EV421DRAFT_1738370 [Armillaria borealis]|uniref:Uncharacterized protein n=1 Tax=Armillaria borealis TaxID=47425 RepID=A0AA39JAX2_9AGAR|nr:hypothetical protein EV421DRAFT_1738370 [Armillaria borealis]
MAVEPLLEVLWLSSAGIRKLTVKVARTDLLPRNIGWILATRDQHNRRSRVKTALANTRAKQRDHCPPEIVAAYALSSLCHSRHQYAKLLPADKGLLFFACSANRYLFALESRNGSSTSYHATYQALQKYAKHDGEEVLKLGTDRARAAVGRLDNIQKYVHPRDYRVGREAHMLIGTAATAFEIEGFTPGMLDLQEKCEWLILPFAPSLPLDWWWIEGNLSCLVTTLIQTVEEYIIHEQWGCGRGGEDAGGC